MDIATPVVTQPGFDFTILIAELIRILTLILG